ncbi:hypothetical protein [Oceanirhabdus sp. W0125-5]|uniref:hypothetical protein n=1 Tax=Oceanirhabdus sp. W0125-5 TaxID=2999116 RepID=UPI0022F2EC39|nr:hypothetical protein [Oceanirhabdus sp. W0125-5]WBW96805.1 hypothetical protein OW730_24410 [Oceanirhabdus sp. W0125-5]
MMKSTLKGIIAGMALVIALLSTSIDILTWENPNRNEVENNFTINANVKIKEGLDVILENI